MKSKDQSLLKAFAVELGLYALLVAVYFQLVLTYLGPLLKELFDDAKPAYAALSLVLILGQGVALEGLTGWLLKLSQKRRG